MSKQYRVAGELLETGEVVTHSSIREGLYGVSYIEGGYIAEQARSIHSALIMLHATVLHFKGEADLTHVHDIKDSVCCKGDPRETLQWLKKHHTDFDDLNFAIQASVIFPEADVYEDRNISYYFAEATNESSNYSGMYNRFCLVDFHPHKNQAVLHVKGRDLKL